MSSKDWVNRPYVLLVKHLCGKAGIDNAAAVSRAEHGPALVLGYALHLDWASFSRQHSRNRDLKNYGWHHKVLLVWEKSLLIQGGGNDLHTLPLPPAVPLLLRIYHPSKVVFQDTPWEGELQVKLYLCSPSVAFQCFWRHTLWKQLLWWITTHYVVKISMLQNKKRFGQDMRFWESIDLCNLCSHFKCFDRMCWLIHMSALVCWHSNEPVCVTNTFKYDRNT